MFKDKTQYKYNAIISTLLVVAIIVVLAIISTTVYFRVDLTENKQFTISKATKNILKDLDDIISVKAYFSEKAPIEVLNIKQEAQDILEEYKNYGKGRLKVEFIDPQEDANLKRDAQGYGVQELQFSNMQKDKLEVSRGYLGVVVLYAGKKEVIPAIKNTDTLEYDLTLAIKKITSEPIKIGFLQGNGEVEQENLKEITGSISRIYDVEQIDISTGDLIAPEIKAIVVAGPTKQFSSREKYIIDQFIMRGGNVLFLHSSAKIADTLSASENSTELEDLLENYGIKVGKDLVLDYSCETVQFSSGYSIFRTPYPFWVSIGSSGFNRENAISGKMESLVLPWTSSLEILDEKLFGVQTESLVSSSKQSWRDGAFNISPEINLQPEKFESASLAVSLFGKFESFFKGKEIPKKESEDGGKNISAVKDSAEFIEKSQNDSRIIAVGNSQFIKDDFVARYGDNATFFYNMLDAVAMDESLISIRSRVSSQRLIEAIPKGRENFLKFLNILGVPIILVIFGIARWAIRKKKYQA
ncbi:MAG: Gldg family protein [bacterium]